jgi:hypothetical protein
VTYQYLSIIGFIAVGAAFFFVSASRNKALMAKLKSPAELSELFGAAFAATRQAGEDDPVCVVAYQGRMALMVGVSNQRVAVLKHDGALRHVAYDAEGEQLGVTEKNRQGRGYFRWSHDKAIGYTPQVVSGPFAREVWSMPLRVEGFAAQHESLREFASRFNFAWFY